jgi:hypothetical protein
MPRKSYAKKRLIENGAGEARGVEFIFTHGATLRCMVSDLSDPLKTHAAAVGLSHSIGDGYSSHPDVHDSRAAEAVAREMWKIKRAGAWSQKRTIAIADEYWAMALTDLLTNRGPENPVTAAEWNAFQEDKRRVAREAPALRDRAIMYMMRDRAANAAAPTVDLDAMFGRSMHDLVGPQ